MEQAEQIPLLKLVQDIASDLGTPQKQAVQKILKELDNA